LRGRHAPMARGRGPWCIQPGTLGRRVREPAAEVTAHSESCYDLPALGLPDESQIFPADRVRCIGRPIRVDSMIASNGGRDHAEDYRHLPSIAGIEGR
jgi:hypothetical protein